MLRFVLRPRHLINRKLAHINYSTFTPIQFTTFQFSRIMSESPSNVFEAAAAGDLTYLSANTHLLNASNDHKWTPLHFAARYGQTSTISFLLAQGSVDKKVVNADGKTAGQVASFWGHEEAAALLADEKKEENKGGVGSLEDNMVLRKKFPDVRKNFFSGSKLNRYGWVRTNKAFLSEALVSPNSSFILFSNLKPLLESSEKAVAWFKYSDVVETVGNPFTDSAPPAQKDSETILIFLGLDETKGGDFTSGKNVAAFWGLDVSPKGEETGGIGKRLEEAGYKFVELRPRVFTIDPYDAAILGQARAMIDWNVRNVFCPACGRRTISSDAGHKRTCPPDQEPSDSIEAEKERNGQRPPCISSKGVHNFSYPRTDSVVIVCVVHPREQKILLGRQKTWPAGMYSCLAGFVEASETIEEAVRREVREESGIEVGSVVYHSSQPWPFPNTLMIGCIAEAVTDQVRLEDKELEDARWFSRSEILESVIGSKAVSFDAPTSPGKGSVLRMPPETAIAHQLVKTWAVEKEWGGDGQLSAKM